MTVQVDKTTLKKLFLVKRVYQQAEIDTSISVSSHRRLLAIVGFDWSIETVLKAILSQLNPTVYLQNINFAKLISAANKALEESNLDLPHQANIGIVRELRNSAQHTASIPSVNDLNDCRTYTRDFLRKIYIVVWNEDFDRFSLASAIDCEEIRIKLQEAETALAEKRFNNAIFAAAEALKLGLYKYQRHYWISSDHLDLPNYPYLETLVDDIENLYEQFDIMALGVDMSEYYRFKRLTWSFKRLPNGVIVDLNSGTSEPAEENDAYFAVSFCTNTMLHIQERYGPPINDDESSESTNSS